MKKEATKKSKLWIVIVAAVLALLLVVGGVVGAVVLLGGGDGDANGPQGGRANLYWNIDKATYTKNSESGLSTREPGEDGIYRVRFAYNGELVELPIADKQLVNYIDTLDCMGVVKNSEGTVIDVVDPKTLATETARMFYIKKVTSDVITLNSSMAMNGMSMDIPVKDVTEIYDVAPDAENPGKIMLPTELSSMDSVTVYSNGLGEATHIYVVSHPVESPVYWRADTGKYNSTEKATTRVPDENGYYTIPFYVNGEYVELKCNVKGIVNTIDAKNRFKAHTGLVLDENGYIVDNMLAATGIRGLLGCEMYDVTEVDGKNFTAEAQLAGSGEIYTNTLTDDAVIYDVSLAAKPDVRGKATDSLRVGDRIVVFENAEGEAILVYVAHRLIDSPMYFNMTKKYSSAKKETTRTPVGGWYYIELFSEGVTKTYKTQDKELINKIDSQNNRSVGLELDGDIITYVWEGECVAGYGAFVGYSVINVTGSILSIAPSSNPDNISNRILHADAKVYNMSGVKQQKGEITTVLPDDYCIMWRNPKSEITYIYVIRRLVNAPVYFSITRKWDSTTESTTREPDEDGFYTYECYQLGKSGTVTVKTKSKKTADFLDSQSPQTFALMVDKDGVIYEYYETAAVYGGNKMYLNNIVKRLDKLVTYYPVSEKVYTPKLAENVKIYNLSSAYERYKGEPTTLQLNDSIQCYTNAKGEIAMILVRIRKVDAQIHFSKDRVSEVTEDGKTARKPDADGWYIFETAYNGKETVVKTKDVDVATFMDAQSPQSFALVVDDNGVIKKAYPTTAATGGYTRAVNAKVVSVDDGKITVRLTTGALYEMPMASKYKVYNVSGDHDKNFGEVTKIKVGDTLQSYTNSENKVSIVFVKARQGLLVMSWNVNPQYDKTNKKSLRTPDEEGLFSVELAVEGKIETYKVRGQSVINYIDSANGAVAITIQKGIIINAQSAIYGPGVWTSVDAAVIATVQEVKEDALVVKTNKDEVREIPLSSKFECYDVTGNSGPKGAVATPKVGDYGRIYLGYEKEAMFFYILSSGSGTTTDNSVWVMAYMAEAAQYDSTNVVTTRTPDADGYYHVKLAVNGEVKTYKTKQTGTDSTGNGICYADQSANKGRAFAIQLVEEGSLEFLHARSAINAPNSKKAGTNGTVAAIDGKTVTLTTGTVVTLADGVQIYDVSTAAASFGEVSTLAVGDNYMSYANSDSELTYIFIKTRVVAEPELPAVPSFDNSDLVFEEGTTNAKCVYCDKVVEWTALEGITEATTLTAGTHYYLAGDITDNTSHYAVTNNCVHLNGHNITSTSRVFAVNNGTTNLLTIIGNGVVTGGYASDATANVAGATISVRGNLNLIGGTYKHANSTLPTIIMAKPQQTINIYEGVTIEGTEGVTGTNLYIMMGVVNMYGGTISGGKATTDGTTGGYGDNVYVHGWTGSAKARAEFNMFGGTVDGGIYATKTTETFAVSVSGNPVINKTNGGLTLDSASGAVLTLNQLGSSAKIYVTGEGAITAASSFAGSYANTKILPAAQGISLKVEENVIIATEEAIPTWKMAWVVDPQYDETNKVTTRTPDAEGYYYIDLSIDGETKTYKTKTTGVQPGEGIDYADQSGAASRAVAVLLTSANSVEFTKANGATTGTGAKGAKVVTLTGVNGNTVTAEGYEGTLAADAKIFDVSSQATVEGEFTTLRVGDHVRFYTAGASGTGEILYGYVDNRVEATEPDPEPVPTWKMAWVVDPQFDETNKVTTRTADAEGYYYIDLSIDGETKTYKTKATGLDETGNGIDYADQSGYKGRAVAVYLTDVNSDEFTSAKSATTGTGAKGAKVVTLTGVYGTTVTAEGYEGTVLADAKIFDVSDKATVEGEFTTLRTGDYVRFYTADSAGTQILYAYIYTRVVVEPLDMNKVAEKADAMASVFATDTGAGVEAECPICRETVTWTALPTITASTKMASGHYYLADDIALTGGYYNINDGVEVCVHLNGKTLSNSTERLFYVDKGSKLNVMGSGNVIGGRTASTSATVFRCGSPLEIVANNSNDATVNLCGGTWSKSKDALDVIGVRCAANGGLNIYDGTTINIGDVQGNALWVAGGNVNLVGGVINGNVLVKKYAADSSTVAYDINLKLEGTTINGTVSYDTSNGKEITTTVQNTPVIAELAVDPELPIQVGRLVDGADIKVTATGAFTAANPNAQNYVDDGFISAKADTKILTVADGIISCVDNTATVYDNSDLVFEEGTTKAMCTYCGEVKEWTAVEPAADASTYSTAEGGHYYLTADLNDIRFNSAVASSCLHLNGHNITNTKNRALSVQKDMNLNVMGNGIVCGSNTTASSFAATVSCAGKMNLLGGTYKHANSTLPTIAINRATGIMNIYEDVVVEGAEGVTGANIAVNYGTVNVYGATISGGTAAEGDLTDGKGGNIYVKGWTGSAAAKAELHLFDADVDGNVYVCNNKYVVVSVNGATKVAKNAGGIVTEIPVTLGRLTKGAEIYLSADGEATVANDRAADYLAYGYVKAAGEGKTITENAGVLSIG